MQDREGLTPLAARCDHNLFDQRTQRLCRFRPVLRIVEGGGETFDFLPEDLRDLRMDIRRVRASGASPWATCVRSLNFRRSRAFSSGVRTMILAKDGSGSSGL